MYQHQQTESAERDLDRQLADFGITHEDLKHFEERKKPLQDALKELLCLHAKPEYPASIEPALLNNGYMLPTSAAEVRKLLEHFRSQVLSQDLEFLVPAAGAASRQVAMLRTLLHSPALESAAAPLEVQRAADEAVRVLSREQRLDDAGKANLKALKEVQQDVLRFWNEGICNRGFAFWEDLQSVMASQGESLEDAIDSGDIKTVARFIVAKEGLNYGEMPKLLMRLHAYPQPDGTRECRLALEDHLRTTAQLLSGAASLKFHFIISEEHQAACDAALEELWSKPGFVESLDRCGFSRDNVAVTWSYQSPATDAVSLDLSTRQMARAAEGAPLLRKAGHGALLPNCSDQICSGMWIQNVDNVLYDNPHIKALVVVYKQVMAGLAVRLEEATHSFIRRLDDALEKDLPDPNLNAQVQRFLSHDLMTEILPGAFAQKTPQEVSRLLRALLDRPIVVAGYVPLEPGQAGGGPFVIETELGGVRVNKVNTLEQAEFPGGADNTTFTAGAFFNPVDLFIARRRHDGSIHDLTLCANPGRFFTSQKPDAQGNIIKAYERPGLWNGSLEGALQVSIAIPANVFSAIKTIAGKESFLAQLHHPYDGPLLTALDFERGVAGEDLRRLLEELCNGHSA